MKINVEAWTRTNTATLMTTAALACIAEMLLIGHLSLNAQLKEGMNNKHRKQMFNFTFR